MKQFIFLIFTFFSLSIGAQTIWNFGDFGDCDPYYDKCWISSDDDFTTSYPLFKVRDTSLFRNYMDSIQFNSIDVNNEAGAPESIIWADDSGFLYRSSVSSLELNWSQINGEPSFDESNTNELELPSQTGNTGKILTTNGSAASWVSLPAANYFTAYSAGTVYTLTTSSAKVDFGTTDPSITITTPGTYQISVNIRIQYNGLTTALNACNFKLRRTNNTAADLINASTNFNVPAVTLLSGTGGDCDMPSVIYTTANSNDVIELWANRSGGLTLGSIEVAEASIVAVRLF